MARQSIALTALLGGSLIVGWAIGCGSTVSTGTGGGGTGGAGTGGAGTGAGVGAHDATSTGASIGGGGTAGAGGSGCAMDCQGFSCCHGRCVNYENDINNCGGCDSPCTGDHPYCDMGQCGTPPCGGQPCAADLQCCGDSECCAVGKLCCTVPGPIGFRTSCLDPDQFGSCPTGCVECKCASPDTAVATPRGPRAIATLDVGDLVYSVERGAVVTVPILEVHRHPAPNHVVVHVDLANGESVTMSPLHPTADGRRFGDLRAGDELGGVGVVGVKVERYAFEATYDILPASESGAYFASGALVGSTLHGP